MKTRFNFNMQRAIFAVAGGLILTGLASCSSNNLTDPLVTGSISQLPKGMIARLIPMICILLVRFIAVTNKVFITA